MDRVGMDFKDINNTIQDIRAEFKYLTLKQIREALRNGSLGLYGNTFRLSTQEVCIWIRKHTQTKSIL